MRIKQKYYSLLEQSGAEWRVWGYDFVDCMRCLDYDDRGNIEVVNHIYSGGDGFVLEALRSGSDLYKMK